MLVLKIIGAVLVLVTGTCMGMSYSLDIQRRYEDLWALKRSFAMIRGDMEYGGMSLADIFGHVSLHSGKRQGSFWECLEHATKSQEKGTFDKIWIESVDRYLAPTSLDSQDIHDLHQVGKVLGASPRGQQLAMIDMYLKRLEVSIDELDREKGQRQRLYNSLGIVGSGFLVILLC